MRKTLRTQGHSRLIALLKEQRLRMRLTQQQVADQLGVPQSFVAKYEGGERRLDVLEFIEAAEALGADPHDLFAAVVAQVKIEGTG
ncbi:helix-turn-helix domain-containing protein [Enterovirga rhinocerotis]|uniref:Helix-turn-helix protein n=1 Tax=Enterovirga rhinocerotis TaxID=1339210 RepID=A0A4R7BIZ4_9HYPH|nr:helix-turn-helix transcriptional regulator [Enterovirga rhinocerotis]TDR85294.1 helix-turn-helix protein [Enterovirga rhinocerotis]